MYGFPIALIKCLYNKTIDLFYKNIQIKGNDAEIDVKVTKNWNYAFSPEIQSDRKSVV